ncbi:LytR/AlgR family response regulator transcription factor [Novilysobacter defluvii]|uniref:Chemotaxis protein CheY n=1 Tax=Lysobacter defluvii IMMIB APB-9 = DSM 18482 TaxID=1385515 RepID=A0A0A0M8X6_9GAMM|nr:LytTR family DNA-binding domain-containing protein [Lysobacter defluvii]KGO98437.1 chemotaxis protein CheY [Lysobacter defluvii IMMIB APB-9 = DSM 18482]
MRVVLADDEPLARTRLAAMLASVDGVELVAEAVDGAQALQACETHRPDLVLLDIAMPGMDGMEAARRLRAMDTPPAVVFCTAYDGHAVSAFEVDAVDFLVKPVRPERLAAALARARTFLAGRRAGGGEGRRNLCSRVGGSLRLIPLEDVHFLQAEEKYVVVGHAGGEHLIEESLKSLEEEFGDRFVRIHRSCLVARARISGLHRGGDGRHMVSLRGVDTPLEVSRRCAPTVREVVRAL